MKIKGNRPYPILLIEASLSPIESITMIRYIIYKNKINNMDDTWIPKIASESNQNHWWLKRGWHDDTKSWINHWRIKEDVILQHIDDIQNIIKDKLKEILWCDKELEDKRKLRYYKEVVNHILEYQKYLSILTSIRKRINIVKIGTNSHELHSEIGHWTIPKRQWHERICHLRDTQRVEDEKQFLLECPVYTKIRCQFQNICHNIDLPNLLSHQNYSNLGMFFEHRNNILKNSKKSLPFLKVQ
jgi:hypothetical protein